MQRTINRQSAINTNGKSTKKWETRYSVLNVIMKLLPLKTRSKQISKDNMVRARCNKWLHGGNNVSITDTQMNSQRKWQYIQDSMQTRILGQRKVGEHQVLLLIRKQFVIGIWWERETTFLQWSVIGHINHTRTDCTPNRVRANTNRQCFMCAAFVWFCLV